uniref:Uncharacterized protein n=1 Tax=Physcomitrium patens TaxID=3218 RepID=A0A2K1KNB6_PHYPA|nr:hypothetical protein PHYPA_006162 [Physcomitrium patens]
MLTKSVKQTCVTQDFTGNEAAIQVSIELRSHACTIGFGLIDYVISATVQMCERIIALNGQGKPEDTAEAKPLDTVTKSSNRVICIWLSLLSPLFVVFRSLQRWMKPSVKFLETLASREDEVAAGDSLERLLATGPASDKGLETLSRKKVLTTVVRRLSEAPPNANWIPVAVRLLLFMFTTTGAVQEIMECSKELATTVPNVARQLAVQQDVFKFEAMSLLHCFLASEYLENRVPALYYISLIEERRDGTHLKYGLACRSAPALSPVSARSSTNLYLLIFGSISWEQWQKRGNWL